MRGRDGAANARLLQDVSGCIEIDTGCWSSYGTVVKGKGRSNDRHSGHEVGEKLHGVDGIMFLLVLLLIERRWEELKNECGVNDDSE